MTETQASKRLHFGWVTALAHVTIIGCFFWDLMLYPASRGVFDFAWFMTVLCAIPVSFLLCLWLLMVWVVYSRKRAWHGRTWVALLPSILVVASMVFHAVSYSRDAHLREIFRSNFAAEIPADARGMDVSAPTLADSGHKDFAFRCSKESTLALIKAMNMKSQEGVPPHYSRLAREWADQNWKGAQWYLCSDKHGVGYLLITDPRTERVLVARNPLFAKSEDEMNGVK